MFSANWKTNKVQRLELVVQVFEQQPRPLTFFFTRKLWKIPTSPASCFTSFRRLCPISRAPAISYPPRSGALAISKPSYLVSPSISSPAASYPPQFRKETRFLWKMWCTKKDFLRFPIKTYVYCKNNAVWTNLSPFVKFSNAFHKNLTRLSFSDISSYCTRKTKRVITPNLRVLKPQRVIGFYTINLYLKKRSLRSPTVLPLKQKLLPEQYFPVVLFTTQ